MMKPAERLLRASLPLWLALTTALAGCGWQLRGTVALPQRISPVYVRGVKPFSPMTKAIESALQGAGTGVSSDATKAASVLHLASDDVGRRMVSVSGRGKGLEYELYESVQFELLDASGKQLVGLQRVTSQRVLLSPEVQALGKQREEEDTRRVMRQDLAIAILERLRAQLH